MIQTSKIRAIPYGAIKEPGDQTRKIPPGMFNPHMDLLSSPSSDVWEHACLALLPLFTDNDGAPHTRARARAYAHTHYLLSHSHMQI